MNITTEIENVNTPMFAMVWKYPGLFNVAKNTFEKIMTYLGNIYTLYDIQHSQDMLAYIDEINSGKKPKKLRLIDNPVAAKESPDQLLIYKSSKDLSISFCILSHILNIEFIIPVFKNEKEGYIQWNALDVFGQKITNPLFKHRFSYDEDSIILYGEGLPQEGYRAVKEYVKFFIIQCIKKIEAQYEDNSVAETGKDILSTEA